MLKRRLPMIESWFFVLAKHTHPTYPQVKLQGLIGCSQQLIHDQNPMAQHEVFIATYTANSYDLMYLIPQIKTGSNIYIRASASIECLHDHTPNLLIHSIKQTSAS